jgi:hypothetical protein
MTDDDTDDCATVGRMNGWRGNLSSRRKSFPSVALATTDPTLDFSRSRTQATAVGSRRQPTAGAMAFSLISVAPMR